MNSPKSNKKPTPLRVVSPLHKAGRQMAIYLTEHQPDPSLQASEGHVLAYIDAYGPCPIAELVRVIGHKKSTMTGMLDRLADRGLITRDVNPEDRRSFLVNTTGAGHTITVLVRRPVEEFDRTIVERVSDRDLAGFERVIQAVADVTAVDVRRDANDTTKQEA